MVDFRHADNPVPFADYTKKKKIRRNKMLRAYDVHPYPDSYDCGCVLVYAHNRDEARIYVTKKGPFDDPFAELRAIRVSSFDKYAEGDIVYSVETNEGLPEPFYRED